MDNDIKNLKVIAEIMKKYSLNQIKLENTSIKYELRREIQNNALPQKCEQIENNELIMKSPLVGIFYRQQSVGTRPFVEVGDYVQQGDTVCLIEAMKMFTEVTADFTGQIIEVCVVDGDIVEFSQPLFKYRV